MARLPRFVLLGQPQHMIQRGNNRRAIFCPKEDYTFYLEKLGKACKKHDCHLHAYVMMTNHIHLLLTPHTDQGIGRVMQSKVLRPVFQLSVQPTGTLWEGRYKATMLDTTAYLLTFYRYIELNPVRAGMVDHPAAYPWSSYPYHTLGKPDARITPHACSLLGFRKFA